jgi:hypothetical protein
VDGKFLGLGLKNIVGLFFVLVLMIVGAKVILAKHPVPGLSTLFHAV